ADGADGVQDVHVVVDGQQAHVFRLLQRDHVIPPGSFTTMVVPLPGLLFTVSWPPCSSTITSRAKGSPSPELCLVEKPGVNSCGSISGGMPGPLSMTSMRKSPPSFCTRTSTGSVESPIASRAF